MAEQTRSERVASALKRLAASAANLTAASDEFSRPIVDLEAALAKLDVGLITWQRIAGGSDDFDNYWNRDVGYMRMEGKWRLVIRAVSGNPHVEDEDVDVWAFNDAPRSYRIEALDKLPDLLEELIKNADKTAKKLKETSAEARELASAAQKAVNEFEQQRKGGS